MRGKTEPSLSAQILSESLCGSFFNETIPVQLRWQSGWLLTSVSWVQSPPQELWLVRRVVNPTGCRPVDHGFKSHTSRSVINRNFQWLNWKKHRPVTVGTLGSSPVEVVMVDSSVGQSARLLSEMSSVRVRLFQFVVYIPRYKYLHSSAGRALC